MAEADIDIRGAEPIGLTLDPFSYQAGIASRVAGLGGSAPGYDPAYVFHTPYVEAAEGRACFTVRFANLKARRGTLILRVHMLPSEAGATARLINSDRIQLNRLRAMGGEAAISFEGYRGVTYALYGGIADPTDAEADDLVVTLDRPASEQPVAEVVAEARETEYGRDGVRPEARLISTDSPTLASPVCQAGTAAQLREPAFDRWAQRIARGATDERARWSDAYVLQVLKRYGLLQPDARGLGFVAGGDRIGDAMRAAGVDATLAPSPAQPADLPRDLVNYDFLWSVDAAATFPPEIGAGFVEASLACLRPGGFAVHVLPFDPDADQDRAGRGDHAAFGRGDIERLALSLISRGHEVAQIRIDVAGVLRDPSGVRPAAFGIIARKAPLAR